MANWRNLALDDDDEYLLGCVHAVTYDVKFARRYADMYLDGSILDELEKQHGRQARSTLSNGIVEGFAVRARCVFEFLYENQETPSKPIQERKYLHVDDFPVTPEFIDELRDKGSEDNRLLKSELFKWVCARAAHVTPERACFGLLKARGDTRAEALRWEPLMRKVPPILERKWRRFLEEIDDRHRDSLAKEWIADYDAPRPPQ